MLFGHPRQLTCKQTCHQLVWLDVILTINLREPVLSIYEKILKDSVIFLINQIDEYVWRTRLFFIIDRRYIMQELFSEWSNMTPMWYVKNRSSTCQINLFRYLLVVDHHWLNRKKVKITNEYPFSLFSCVIKQVFYVMQQTYINSFIAKRKRIGYTEI